MGTTSEKLTYLNTTKEKIRDSINLTGANIGTSDTFRSYATKLKLGLIDIINNGTDTLYSNFPKVSGIGTNLSLTPTYEAPMKLNEIQGDTFQQTYEGNNLLNPIPNTLPNTLNGISVTKNTDGSLDINGTATSNWANITNKISTNLEPNTYKFLINSELTHTIVLRLTYSDETYSDLNILAGSKKREITTAKTIVSYYVYLILNAGTTYSEKVYLQLKLSSSSDDYEPYVGGTASPNPDYPQAIQNVTGLQNIEVCGKNLFDGVFELGDINTTTGENNSNNSRTRTKNYIIIEPETTYTLSTDTQNGRWGVFYDKNKNFLSRISLDITGNNTSKTFTSVANAYYFRWYLLNNTSLNVKEQLQLGSTATSYEEYKGQSYEINLGKNLYDVSTCTNAYINSTGVVTSANTNLLTDYIKIDNTQKYTISLNTEFYFIGCAYYDKNKTYLSRDTINNSSSLTITIPNNTEYIRVWMSYATNTNISKTSVMQYEPMIEKGTQRTSYSPYFTPIELCKIGDYQDYIYKNNGDWYLHKEIGKVVLDGSENITNPSNTGYSNTILRFNITVADKKYGKSGTIVDDILSNNFTCEKLDYDARTIESIAGHAAEHIVIIFIDKSRLSTENVQGFKTWLSTHNTMVYYVLATPTDTLITNTELIEDLETLYTAKSQEGTTNISITSEDLEMILNISALRGEV